jgi:hypothetical protein
LLHDVVALQRGEETLVGLHVLIRLSSHKDKLSLFYKYIQTVQVIGANSIMMMMMMMMVVVVVVVVVVAAAVVTVVVVVVAALVVVAAALVVVVVVVVMVVISGIRSAD